MEKGNKHFVRKKKMQSTDDKKEIIKLKKMEKKKAKKIKQMMKKRLIIRNLSFQVTEEELKEIFSKFGDILDVNIPVNKDGKKRGFAFIRYKEGKSLIKAMKEMNFKKIKDRPIAIDYAVPKLKYQLLHRSNNESTVLNNVKAESDIDQENVKNESDSEDESVKNSRTDNTNNDSESDENEDEDEKRAKVFLKEFSGGNEDNFEDTNSSDSSGEDLDQDSASSNDSDEDNDKESNKYSDNTSKINSKQVQQKRQSDDLSEKKTVFIRNVSFQSCEEDLQDVVEEFGDIYYCLLCIDPITEHPKGTAFVKFKEKESAEKFIQESENGQGIYLDGRKLLCTYAVPRNEISQKDDSKRAKDKRNLRLLKCGLIMNGSKEAESVSQSDMTKRHQLEIMKKKKLQNVNFFVSDKRLAIHNLPKNFTDKNLRLMFQKAAGKEAKIKEARVMKDFKKTDAQGIPISRGFGFVTFTEHEHALKALMELNNNPHIFTPQKRPIVEFSVENKVALLSQERKKEKMKLLSKRKEKESGDQSQQNKNEFKSRFRQTVPKHIKKIKHENGKEDMKEEVETENSLSPKISFTKKLKQENRKQDIKEEKTEKSSLSKRSFTKKKKNKKNNILPFKKMHEQTEISSEGSKKKSKKRRKKPFQKKKESVFSAQDRRNLSALTSKYKEKLLNKSS